MAIARHPPVRLLPCLAVLCAAIPAAAYADPSILAVEPRVGRGVSLGGGAGEGHARISPMTVGVLLEYAFSRDPWLSCYGGPFAEVLDRGSIGGMAGIRLRPAAGAWRLGLGGAAIFAPYTLAGPTVSVGASINIGPVPLSLDVEGTAYFVGSDLPEGTVAGQVLLVLGFPLEIY
jgi:hypothetical protein